MARRIHESIEVQVPLQDVFAYWSNLENFPHIMQSVEEVRVAGDTSHWRVKGPLGKSVEFDARITEANLERGIAWQSIEGSEVDTSGQVRFEEIATGRTHIDVTMHYADPPGGRIGEVVAGAVWNPERDLREDLENFARRAEQGDLRQGRAD